MEAPRDKRERLRRLLAAAYRAKENREVNPRWRQEILARVRESAPAEGKTSFPRALGEFAWRLAPVTFAMSVGLAFLLAVLYITTRYDGFQLLAAYVEALTVRQIFGT